MKQLSAVMIAGLLLFTTNVYSQRIVQVPNTIIIKPYSLTITLNKTTNIIFPYAIRSVDRGSKDVLAQKVKGVENVLLVKAGRENFKETNLSVITSDGKLYSFLLSYSNNPTVLNISFVKDTASAERVPLVQTKSNEAQLQLTSERIANQKRMLHGIKDYKYRIKLALTGIYIKEDVVFYGLEVKNRSNINYDIDGLRFFIRDGKRAKRTATQEIELQPLYVYGDTSVVKGGSENILVFALPKFTIGDQKYLAIQLMEKEGGRQLELKVHNRTIVKAKIVEP